MSDLLPENSLIQESPPAGNLKRHTAHGITSPRGLPQSQPVGGSQSCPGQAEGTPVLSWLGRHPSPVLAGGSPVSGRGYPRPRVPPPLTGYPLPRTGVPPSRIGVPHLRMDMGPETWGRTWDWGTPSPC